MSQLIADRFLALDGEHARDLATGHIVMLRITACEPRARQQEWSEDRAAAIDRNSVPRLVDFGLVGPESRFEAFALRKQARRAPSRPSADVRRLVARTIDWLEQDEASASCRLTVSDDAGAWIEPLSREARLHGFIPLNRTVLESLRGPCQREFEGLGGLIADRSIVLLWPRVAGENLGDLADAFLTISTLRARNVAAIVGDAGRDVRLVTRAAEKRSPFGLSSHSGGLDPRALKLMSDARATVARGRHAAGERLLRAAIAAFDRRSDAKQAADATSLLAALLLERGRPVEAEELFERARSRFQELNETEAAVSSSIFAGIAQTDQAALDRGCRTLRAALSAALALGSNDLGPIAAVALSRNLYWQARYEDALRVLDQPQFAAGVRYWSLMTRNRLALGCLELASCAARQAAMEISGEPEAESLARHSLALVQARIGDLDALSFHVRQGILAAHRTHRPLQAVRLRLVEIEGMLEAGSVAKARLLGRRLQPVRKAVPALLRKRIDTLLERLASGQPASKTLVSTARERQPSFSIGQVELVTRLLALTRDIDDEREALATAAQLVRKQCLAIGSCVFMGSPEQVSVVVASDGVVSANLARRCLETSGAIGPEQTEAGVEAAAPILCLGRVSGALVCRWSVEGPHASDVLATLQVAAAVCAPLVHILAERANGQVDAHADEHDLIGVSAEIQEIRRLITRAALAPFTVLIEGESGAGKEVVAQAVHRNSHRRARAFCPLNCAALTEDLIDAELFGHMKGAFTGAAVDRVGLFESAAGGSVFLDEVGELSPRAQAKLLRVLQEGEIRRIGENFTRPVDARLIAATNRSLKSDVEAGHFRQDLYYRLDVIRISVPPLRERVEDIPLLAARFWRQATERLGSRAVLSQSAMATLARYDWPGNVRELHNVLTALAVSVPRRGVVSGSLMPAAIARAAKLSERETLDQARQRFEARFVRAALARTAGHRGQTAAALGVSRQGLAKLMHRLQIHGL